MLKRKSLLSLLMCIMLLVSSMFITDSVPVYAADFTANSNSAYNWLVAQQNLSGTGLVDSFEDSQSICYTYDQAVATIAFSLKNDRARAQQVLIKLKELQYAGGSGDGSWYTAYYRNGSVQERNKHVGPILWVPMAIMTYQEKFGDTSYQGMATWAIDWCLKYQDMNTGSPTYGGIKGGVDQNYFSIEHNQDAYETLRYFARVSGKAYYNDRANLVRNFIINKAWEPGVNRFVGAINVDGSKNGHYPLDVNPWGVLSLGAAYSSSLNYVETSNLYKNTINGIEAYDFNSDRNDLWFEGTAFMSVAYALAGDTAKSDHIISNIIKKQTANGGVAYSLYGTHNGYWQMSSANCVSSTGWLIMAIAKWNPFTAKSVASSTSTMSGYYKLENRGYANMYVDSMSRNTNGSDCGQWSGSSSYNQQWEFIHVTGAYYKLKNRTTGLFLDGMGRTANGSVVGMWSNSSNYNQQWEVINLGNGYYKLKNRATGMMIDNGGQGTNGSQLKHWADDGHYNKQWKLHKL